MAKAKTAEAQEKTKTADEAEAVVEKAEPEPEAEVEQPEEQTPPPPEFTDEEEDLYKAARDKVAEHMGFHMRRMSYTAPVDTISIRDICENLTKQCETLDRLNPKTAQEILASYEAEEQAQPTS